MKLSANRSALLFVVALVLVSVPNRCVAYSSMGPYELMLLADSSDFLVVGDVVGDHDFDPNSSAVLSFVHVRESLYGSAENGDTLAVKWRTPRDYHVDGSVTITTEPGPQLWGVAGPHIWMLANADGSLRSMGDPIPLSSSSHSTLTQYLEWAQAPRRPYAGASRDPEKARAGGLDPEKGEIIRHVLAAYLLGYLDASGAEQ